VPELLKRALLDRGWVLADRTAGAAGANSGETDAHSSEEETDMTSTARPMSRVSGRLRQAIAGAVVVTALTAAAAPGPMAALAAGPTRPDPGPATGAGTPPRGFLLDRGRFTTVHVPGAKSSQAQGINNRGQIVIPELGTGLGPVAP
jgi:hypothetical protein